VAVASDPDRLLDLLAAQRGIVCAVGAGGKKSLLYRLAALHPGRVGITTTAHIQPFPDSLDARVVIGPPGSLIQAVKDAAAASRRVAYACLAVGANRYAGLPPALVAQAHRCGGFDATLVKADGARMRWIKAPAENEPMLPPGCDLVLPLVSARAMGKPLSDTIAHRIDRLSAVTGAHPGDVLTPLHLARLLACGQGSLQGAAGARVIPVINMVDNARLETLATESARIALDLTDRFDRVLLTCLKRERPVVAVVSRRR
jgi:probable selenium-dependent hydroxylase accessory protein YqeC